MELYKHKGSPLLCDSYRDISLGHTGGKAAAAVLRARAQAPLEHAALETQFGSGLGGGSTDVAHLYLRALRDAADAMCECVGMLFVDVTKAFPRLCRALALPLPVSDEQFVRRLRASGFSDQAITAVLDRARNEQAWGAPPGSPHLAAALAERHIGTWAACEYLDSVLSIDSGSITGSALGDLIFSAAMSVVLRSVRAELSKAGLLRSIPAPADALRLVRSPASAQDATTLEASFVDDAVFPVFSAAGGLLACLQKAAAIVDHEFALHGMEVNYEPGKTEIVVSLAGQGAQECKLDLAYTQSNQVTFLDHKGCQRKVAVVESYKHLGTRYMAAASMQDEIRARCGLLRGTCSSLRRLLRDQDLSVQVRALILQAYVMTRALFQCGSWPLLRAQEFDKFHAAMMSSYREIVPHGGEEWLSDAAVLQATQLPAPAVLLVRQRLLLFNRVLDRAPDSVLVVLAAARPAKRSWLRAIDHDAEWAAQHAPAFRELRGLGAYGWVPPCRADRRAMHRSIVNACDHADLRQRSLWARVVPVQQAGEPVQCKECLLHFPTLRACSTHEYRAHGILREARRLVQDVHCIACLQYFHTLERTRNHIADRSPRCRLVYETVVVPMCDAEYAIAQQQDREEQRALRSRGRRHHHAAAPAVRLSGPLLQEAIAAGICHRRLLHK